MKPFACILLSYHRLKSDQNGIEMQQVWAALQPVFELKSDQNGIEMVTVGVVQVRRVIVKIRPKWDWNQLMLIDTISPFKVKIRPKWDWNRNPTTRNHRTRPVKIRPKWDWNCFLSEPVKSLTAVKIRPKWDWNFSRVSLFSLNWGG